MWKRLWNYFKSLLTGGANHLENPEQLLRDAQIEMREKQARNRERAVQVVMTKNNLRAQVDDMKKRIDSLNAKADDAHARGDREAAQKLLHQRDVYQNSLTAMEESLIEAEALTERVKKAIEYEEETIRRKTREALELKAQWENSHIYAQMQKDLMGGTRKNADTLLWWVVAAYIVLVLLLLLVMWLAGPG